MESEKPSLPAVRYIAWLGVWRRLLTERKTFLDDRANVDFGARVDGIILPNLTYLGVASFLLQVSGGAVKAVSLPASRKGKNVQLLTKWCALDHAFGNREWPLLTIIRCSNRCGARGGC